MRLKHRYIIAQILYDNQLSKSKSIATPISIISARDILNSFREKILSLFGEIGAGEISQSASIRYFDNECLNIFILRCSREAQINLCFGLTCMNLIKGMALVIRVLNVSSSVRTCMNHVTIIYQTVESETIHEEKKQSLQKSIGNLSTIDL